MGRGSVDRTEQLRRDTCSNKLVLDALDALAQAASGDPCDGPILGVPAGVFRRRPRDCRGRQHAVLCRAFRARELGRDAARTLWTERTLGDGKYSCGTAVPSSTSQKPEPCL